LLTTYEVNELMIELSNSEKILLLASGGIDSTALLDFYLKHNNNVECIHFQYGQPNAQSEKTAIEKITEYYKVKKRIINLDIIMARRNDEFIGRNAFFILATSALGISPARIALGIHSGSRYYDCTKDFLNDCQRILDGYFAGVVKIEAPFIDFTKSDIIRYCKKYKVPVELTYSCFRQNYPPCGNCPSCLDRAMLNENRRSM